MVQNLGYAAPHSLMGHLRACNRILPTSRWKGAHILRDENCCPLVSKCKQLAVVASDKPSAFLGKNETCAEGERDASDLE